MTKKFILDGKQIPPYPSYGVGGGSALEARAQDDWERKYGPPPGEPGSRVQVVDNVPRRFKTADGIFGCYFDATDLCVFQTGQRGTGQPSNVEWLD